MRRFRWIVLAMLVALAGPSPAEIYRWTDEAGRTHFTQDLSEVPAEHRRAAVERTLDEEEGRLSTFKTRPAKAAPPRTARPALRPAAPPLAPARKVHRIRVQRAGTTMMVTARINNSVNVPFVVDTGASDVSIPRWAAERLQLESARTRQYLTANGVIEAKAVMLDSVDLAGAVVEDVPASVSSSMQVGLLGLSYFNHFTTHVDAASGILTLVRNDLAESGQIRGGRSEAQWRSEYAGLRARIARLEYEIDRTNPNQSRKVDRLEEAGEELLRQLEVLDAEADQARVPMAWRE